MTPDGSSNAGEDLAGKVQQPVRWPKREVCDLETSNTELIAEATWEVKPQQMEHVVPKVFLESLWPSELEAVGNHSTLAFSAPADLAYHFSVFELIYTDVKHVHEST